MFSARMSRPLTQPVVVAVALALVLLPVSAAFGAFSATTQTVYTSGAAPEAVELGDLVASPAYPSWFWSVSDVWKTTDTFAACAAMSGPELNDCRQVQRARLWAFKLDPSTHVVVDVRSFAVSDPAMAWDPYGAQNNDWEDMTLGPVRTADDGTTTENLIIGATGDARVNRVYDSNGTDITCDTRRLIEVPEPDLNDPDTSVWSPWRIYDLKNVVGTYGKTSCNIESVVQAPDSGGAPRAYLVTRTGGKVFSRTLDPATGRDPATPTAAVGSGLPYEPSLGYVGRVADSRGAQFTSAETNGQDIAMVSPASSTKPCQVFRWTTTGDGLAATITSVSPAKDAITCRYTEGMAFTRDPNDISVLTRDLYTLADSKTTFRYWFLPWS